MGIGVSIFLIALGAVLTFALNVSVPGIDLGTVGIILMIVGALGLVASMVIWGPRRRAPVSGEVVEERRIYDDRPPY
jgi:hypothetical protein